MKKFFKILAIIIACIVGLVLIGGVVGGSVTGNWNVPEWVDKIKDGLGGKAPDEKDPDEGGNESEHTHTYSKTVIQATCTAQGYTLYSCDCGATYKMNYTAMTSHHYVCADCGAVENENNVVSSDNSADPYYTTLTFISNVYPFTVVTKYYDESSDYETNYTHSIKNSSTKVDLFDDWDSAYASSEELVDIYNFNNEHPLSCSIDYKGYCAGSERNVVVNLTFSNHTHSYTETVVQATCTAQGYTLHTCVCGESYKDNYTAITSHNYVDYVCTVCGAVDPNKPAPHGHSYTETVVPATCTTRGYTLYECECGKSYKDNYTEMTGHHYVCTECGSDKENSGDSSVNTVAYPWAVDCLPCGVRYGKEL